ncbi:uncharacterized protein LOC113305856 [Papaver somniferum]|uniref:uncharacterized protein LOC113305856 n=1 Tax=Papaver somniferum TaxID=3469 RepID=UPI000E6FB746|nr:uncharacterized protein LOC113305856 [Papaver somniferum]
MNDFKPSSDFSEIHPIELSNQVGFDQMSINDSQSRIIFRVRKNSDFGGGGVDKETPFQKQELKFYQRKPKNLMEETKMGAETVSNKSELNNGTTCLECGKNFSSLKSLYGHLRCHPKREKKMIVDDRNKNSPSISGRLLGCDWLCSLSGWVITGRRGRKGFPSAIEREALNGLLMLVNGNSLDLERKRTRYQAVNREISRKRSKLDGDNGGIGIECGSKLMNVESRMEKLDGFGKVLGKDIQVDEVHLGNPTYTGCVIPVYLSSSTGNLTKKFSQYGMMNCNNQTTMRSTNAGTLHCYQALGCHESSVKAEVEELSIPERNLTQADYDVQKFNASTIMQNNVKTYPCGICGKSFATGYALGGHKRAHRNAPRKHLSTPFLEEALAVG